MLTLTFASLSILDVHSEALTRFNPEAVAMEIARTPHVASKIECKERCRCSTEKKAKKAETMLLLPIIGYHTLPFSGIYFAIYFPAETNENDIETFVSARGLHVVAESN